MERGHLSRQEQIHILSSVSPEGENSGWREQGGAAFPPGWAFTTADEGPHGGVTCLTRRTCRGRCAAWTWHLTSQAVREGVASPAFRLHYAPSNGQVKHNHDKRFCCLCGSWWCAHT